MSIRRTLFLGRRPSGVHQTGSCCSSSSSSCSSFSSSGGLVLRSRSTDVFLNLALEDWIDAHVDLERRGLLLLWSNRPAVVIGRHQNPWSECHLAAMRSAGVPLARRRSGGGTVFHDLGNLNLTFFSSKKAYDRRRNLEVITGALRRLRPRLAVHATERFDILLDGHFKISGSASRLSRKSSYHHCTLLHSADRAALAAVLRPSCPGIHSNATPSVPSPVANLRDHAPTLEWEELLDALAHQYNAEFGSGASPPASTLVDPADESAFPGVARAAEELRGWDWTFGRTPRFGVRTALPLEGARSARLHAEVKGGVVESCELDAPVDWLPARLSDELSGALVGGRFCPHRAAAAFSELMRTESGERRRRLHRLCDAVVSVMG
ncbi:Lipoyltransferase 1, mitochondrial [Liparis tanakae]|uniref:Lipoyltransferase 1, mitochondrial n=1 Tax=Liparis tanakae TaxID=230148 RepID=A0A4Z2FH89_9TELE|nr:Lipoyltransferase 1, mitochondrial [Liparis tanakae]